MTKIAQDAPRRPAGRSAPTGRHPVAELDALGNVPASYRHHRRLVTPGESLAIPGVLLKWYELRRHEVEMPHDLAESARATVRRELEAGRIDTGYGLGFVVIHDCNPITYLIVGIWKSHNELWESIYLHDREGSARFEPFPRTGRDMPLACIWELAPIWHERGAWVRYLESARDEPAKRAFLADMLSGSV